MLILDIGPSAGTGKVVWTWVLFVSPSILSVLQNRSMALRDHMGLCLTANWIFWEKSYTVKMVKKAEKREFTTF